MAKTTSTLPYIAWDTFLSFIGHLKSVTVPAQIDNSVMSKSTSGANRAGLMTALRFFKFIDGNGTVSQSLKDFVATYGPEDEADKTWEDKWNDLLLRTVLDAYDSVLNGLALDTATSRQLDERFEAAGAVGQMRQKCVRFFLSAAMGAGVNISPHLLRNRSAIGPKPVSRNGPPKKRKTTDAGQPPNENENDDVPPGMIEIPIHVPGKPKGVIRIHDDLNEADCAMVNAILIAHAKRRTETK
jgi:hypothetical protein